MNANKNNLYTVGIINALALAALTILEYFMAINHAGAPLLFLVAIVKAALVLRFFMHVNRLWSTDEGH